jgi:MFS family permease
VSGFSTAIVGVLIAKVGKDKMAVLAGWAILALGCGLLELFDMHTSAPQWIFVTAVSGLGGGILFTALTIAAQAHVSREHIGIAAALTPFVRAVVSTFQPRDDAGSSKTLTVATCRAKRSVSQPATLSSKMA